MEHLYQKDKPYGGYGSYEAFVDYMNDPEGGDFGFFYKDKEYWIIYQQIRTRRKKRDVIGVYYTDACALSDEEANRQIKETQVFFPGHDIRNVIENYIMYDGRLFKDILKKVGSIEWIYGL